MEKSCGASHEIFWEVADLALPLVIKSSVAHLFTPAMAAGFDRNDPCAEKVCPDMAHQHICRVGDGDGFAAAFPL
jgi:hypothetical protein